MNRILRDELREIAADSTDWCVSILMPTHVAGAGIQQDPIRLKNLVRGVSDELSKLDCGREEAAKLLGPAKALEKRFEQKQSGGRGVAVFTRDGFSQVLRLPFQPPEIAVVSRAFHLAPVLQAVQDLETFYLLALNLNRFRLYECDAEKINEIEIPELQEIAGDASKSVAGEKQLHFHTGSTPAHGTERAPQFHGQGRPSDRQKERLVRAFRRCDRAICGHAGVREAPLVVAGVEYYLPLYREVSSHPQVLDQVVAGSPEPMTSAQLHNEACRVARLHFDEPRRVATARCEELLGTSKASDRLDEVLPAAREGRVEVLLLDANCHRWGFDGGVEQQISVHESRMPGDEDLLSCAARHVMLNGGEVFPLFSERAPGGGDLAAVLRY